MPRPGCMLRGALVSLGGLFLPLAVWFSYVNLHRYWGDVLGLLVVSFAFLKIGLSRDDDGFMAAIDELGAGRARK